MPPHECVGDRCETIKRLRGLRWRYQRIANKLGITRDMLRRCVSAHSRVIRDGAASCITCRRMIDARVPETKLLGGDECCLWCGRRHDGDSRFVVTLLERMAQTEGRPVENNLLQWSLRTRVNSAEIGERRWNR